MKKITLFVLLTITVSFSSFAQLPENFDSGVIPPGWATFIGTNGEGTTANWENPGTYMRVGFEAVATTSQDWLVTPLVAITPTTSLLSFSQTDAYAPDYGSVYTVRVSTASQTTHADFTIVDTQNETSVTNGTPLAFSPYSVDLSAYEGQSVYIAFVLEQNDGDYWFVDNVAVENQNAVAPGAVTTPTPADAATNVYVNPADGADADTLPDMTVVFDWTPGTTGDPATGYEVYLGDSPATLQLLGTTPNDNVNITGMEYSTLYYWQIVAKNAGGSAVGSSIWSFTTEADPALSVADETVKLFSVSPNPVKNNLKIVSQSTLDSIEIYNQLGQRVMEVKANALSNNTIDLSSLHSGMYFITVNAQGKKQTIKIIKE